MKYRPRKSSAKWLVDAPEYILACYDYGFEYTILFGGSLLDELLLKDRKVHFLGVNKNLSVSYMGEVYSSDRKGLGKHVRWLDLPINVREHIQWRVK